MMSLKNIEILDRIVQRGTLNILCQESRFRGPWAVYSAERHAVSYMFNIDYGSVTIVHNAKETLFDLFENLK